MENIWYWCICIWNKHLGEADEEDGYDIEDDAAEEGNVYK